MTARTAIVTGAARGIGGAITARLLRDGWRVTAIDRDPMAAAANLHVERGDVADEGCVNDIVHRMLAREGRLDALVCNAGFMIRKRLADLGLSEWRAVLDTNLTSIFLLAKATESALRASKGAIVTLGSTRAQMSEPDTESYSASKGGIAALTHALAISLAPVRVNCISPGWINTQGAPLSAEDHAQHPVGRVGVPDDVAALAAYLLGPESGFVTGSEFVIDGGMTRKMIYAE
ncbi:putative glucose 1-dehydrogenase [Neoasaia chiangmaiensis NBRC 101099]|uniref:Oxidoreductase n=1 Tax=Neoasaia chiangmaiensis TaxID=320497 RepID=A0A1U9KMB2_9PROT|nr:SDR family oxidoreductase [Neoasaia chiangmaiensis]AQS86915.1 oxidoreductase [Neoasaia chiangmaiensis]GBR37571.1 putative glucose 1-dehydrogenase [Neoasaia chiangmaiensis NBRC 101099]GEN15015.1 oxidoreductase [Neoasaia chiangmaiensis]